MRLFLLTHSTERAKLSNTGRLVQEILGPRAVTIVWQRTTPDPQLLRQIAASSVALCWPSVDEQEPKPAAVGDFVLIDATWQQARKIYNRSAYLHELPRVGLSVPGGSRYTLRRNQVEGGLCTLEAAATLMAMQGETREALALQERFERLVLEGPPSRSPV
ncbi:MAG: DTW domain-containing protein [Nannocystaceae bacterium]|nr:DTW domain-containing protein [Nannocystaceae bacterium]